MFRVFTLWLNYHWKMIKFKNLDLDRGLMTTPLVTVSYTTCVCALPFSCVQLFVTPWTAALQALLSIGFSRQEDWSGLPFPPPEDLPDPGIKLASSALPGGFFTTVHQGSPVTLQALQIYLSHFISQKPERWVAPETGPRGYKTLATHDWATKSLNDQTETMFRPAR